MEKVRQIILMKQFAQSIPVHIRSWLLDRKSKTLKEMAKLADEYISVHVKSKVEVSTRTSFLISQENSQGGDFRCYHRGYRGSYRGAGNGGNQEKQTASNNVNAVNKNSSADMGNLNNNQGNQNLQASRVFSTLASCGQPCTLRCFWCKKLGHIIANCRVNLNAADATLNHKIMMTIHVMLN